MMEALPTMNWLDVHSAWKNITMNDDKLWDEMAGKVLSGYVFFACQCADTNTNTSPN